MVADRKEDLLGAKIVEFGEKKSGKILE